jgi:hypothetical protein
MKFIKAIFLFLLLLSIFSCNRNPANFEKNETQKSFDTESKSRIETQEITKDSVLASKKKDSTIVKGGQNQSDHKKNISQSSDTNFNTKDSYKPPFWNWWMIVAISLFLLNIVLIWEAFRVHRANDKLSARKSHYKKKSEGLNNKLENIKRENNSSIQESKNKQKDNPINDNDSNPNTNQLKNNDEKSPEISLSLENLNFINKPAEKPITLYAEKADEHGVFSQVSEQKNEHKSIFKFYLHDKNDDTAHFEIIDSNFILKMVANSPDIYLYTVCKPENNNQNFTGEIITTQRGIAHKVEGCWKLQDENKAIIKFQ